MNRRDIIKLLIIAAVLVLAVTLVNRIGASQQQAEAEIVREAIKNAALTCYGVEGAYPDSLEAPGDSFRASFGPDQIQDDRNESV